MIVENHNILECEKELTSQWLRGTHIFVINIIPSYGYNFCMARLKSTTVLIWRHGLVLTFNYFKLGTNNRLCTYYFMMSLSRTLVVNFYSAAVSSQLWILTSPMYITFPGVEINSQKTLEKDDHSICNFFFFPDISIIIKYRCETTNIYSNYGLFCMSSAQMEFMVQCKIVRLLL